jgi:uncharacterized protein with PIN domain
MGLNPAVLLCAECGYEERPSDRGWVAAAVEDTETGEMLRIAFCPECARREFAAESD